MPIKPKLIEEATADERRAYVENFLNLPVEPGATAADIDALIAKAQPNQTMLFVNEPDTIEENAALQTAGEPELKPEESAGRQAGTLGKGDPRAVIFIPAIESDDGSGSRDVSVGVNGRAWLLKRGHDLSVPWRVVCALENAVADSVRHRSDEGHEGEVMVTKVDRFNFRFVSRPSDEEIAAWKERTGAQFCA